MWGAMSGRDLLSEHYHVCGWCGEPIYKDFPAFISRGGLTTAYHREGTGASCYMRAQWESNGTAFKNFFDGLGEE